MFDPIEDLGHQRLIAHQRRTGGHFAHLLRRTAHVDVYDLRAVCDVDPGGLCHPQRISADNLHHDWSGLAIVIEPPNGLARAVKAGVRGHHLRDRHAGTETPAQRPEGAVRDSGHWCGDQIVVELMMTDAHCPGGLCQPAAE